MNIKSFLTSFISLAFLLVIGNTLTGLIFFIALITGAAFATCIKIYLHTGIPKHRMSNIIGFTIGCVLTTLIWFGTKYVLIDLLELNIYAQLVYLAFIPALGAIAARKNELKKLKKEGKELSS